MVCSGVYTCPQMSSVHEQHLPYCVIVSCLLCWSATCACVPCSFSISLKGSHMSPCSRPLFWLVSKEPCMESPNQYLSPKPSFARIAPTSFEIQGSKLCSTISPLPLRHCFGWFQGNHVWKAQTSTFHQNLLLPGLLEPVSRSKGPKCARLSAPSLCATVLVGFKETMYGKPQPVPFTRTFFCQDCSNQFRDLKIQSVLDYPPPPSAPPFW